MFELRPDDPEGGFSRMFGPGAVDHSIRQSIQMCWMMLPADKKTPDDLEATYRHLVERALQNWREDSGTFKSE